jgi:membrane protein DedA with SNARE-associated domain
VGHAVELAILFAIVFALNVIPAFAPPTWIALSWVGFTHPQGTPFVVAMVAATAATAGRLVLASLSQKLIRQRFLGDAMRRNIDVVRDALERHRTLTFSVVLAYAVGPFPSNYLFIAYGLTALPLWLVAVPFLVGRFVSYSFFVFAGARVSQRLALVDTDAQQWFGAYFVLSQVALLGAVVVLAHIDWHHLVSARRVRWLRRDDQRSP